MLLRDYNPLPNRTTLTHRAVAFDAEPFYHKIHPLEFRGVPDTLAEYHLEGSECCLIHADNPLSHTRGVWLNPDVRVGYHCDAYNAVHTPLFVWPPVIERIRGIWQNRLLRWTTFVFHKEWVVKRRMEKWRKQKLAERYEPGIHCLINEMQVLVSNGWAHV